MGVSALLNVACGSDSESQGTIATDGAMPEQQPSDPLRAACAACNGQRCVGIRVTLEQSSTELPWKKFEESTGRGLLVAGIGTDFEGREVTLVDDDFESELFAFCTTAEEVSAICYVDDAGNGKKPIEGVTGPSGDYRDTCPLWRNQLIKTKPDSPVMVECVLLSSCD